MSVMYPLGSWNGVERRIAVIAFIDAVGTGVFLGGSAVFFTEAVHLTAAQIGIGVSAGAIVGLFTTFPIGILSDRYGPRRTLIGICLWRSLGFASYALVDGFAKFVLVACFLGIADKSMAPVMQALVDVASDSERRNGLMALIRAARNAGFGIGGLIAVAPVQIGGRISYDMIVLVNSLSFVIAGILVSAVRIQPSYPACHIPGERRSAWRALRDLRYMGLTMLNGILMLNQTMLLVGIPLWAIHDTVIPHGIIPAFLVINTVAVTAFQVSFRKAVQTLRMAVRSFVAAGLLSACSAALVAATSRQSATWAASLLIMAVLVQTVGELLNSAASWQISFSYAPHGNRGSYFALFSLGSSIETSIGPYAFTDGVMAAGPAGWLGLAACFGIAGLMMPAMAYWGQSRDTATAQSGA
jgi:MFS family permease